MLKLRLVSATVIIAGLIGLLFLDAQFLWCTGRLALAPGHADRP